MYSVVFPYGKHLCIGATVIKTTVPSKLISLFVRSVTDTLSPMRNPLGTRRIVQSILTFTKKVGDNKKSIFIVKQFLKCVGTRVVQRLE